MGRPARNFPAAPRHLAVSTERSGPSYGNFCEKTRNFAHLQSYLVILLIFFTKIAITQPKKVKIQIFLCLKSSTNIWPSLRNIYSVPKVIKI